MPINFRNCFWTLMHSGRKWVDVLAAFNKSRMVLEVLCYSLWRQPACYSLYNMHDYVYYDDI